MTAMIATILLELYNLRFFLFVAGGNCMTAMIATISLELYNLRCFLVCCQVGTV